MGITKNILVSSTGSIDIRNDSDVPVTLSKHEHFADVTTCIDTDVDDLGENHIYKIYDLHREDISHLIPQQEEQSADKQDYLNEILIDPDNILTEEWKNRFFSVCQAFSHIITPRPGKYNGFYGRIDNSINFASSPPPSVKAHLPKYNHEKLKIMADKMDQLEKWGVLKKNITLDENCNV